MLEQKIGKITAQNKSLCLQNITGIHYHHSQQTCRLTEPAHVLSSAEDCEIPPNINEWVVSHFA